MKVHLELFVRGTTMERKECYEDVQICKTEMDKERKGEYIFSCFFCAFVGDISVILWYAEKSYICQSYLTYFCYHARHNIFGMFCERFALLKQWPSVQLSILVFVFESISVGYFWDEKWEWDVCQSHSRLDVTCFGRKSYHTTAVLFVQCVFHKFLVLHYSTWFCTNWLMSKERQKPHVY